MAVVEKIGTVFNINSTTAGVQFTPVVTALQNGGYVVAWNDLQSGIVGQRYDEQDFRISGEFLISTTTNNQQGQPDIDTLSNGNFIVTWMHEFSTTDLDIRARRFTQDGVAIDTGDFPIAASGARDESVPSVSATNDGRYLVAWQQDDGISGFTQRDNNNGVLSGGPAVGLSGESRPCVAALLDGSFAVIYQRGNQIWERRMVAGDGSQQVSDSNTGLADNPSVAALEGGGYVVVFRTGGNDAVTAARPFVGVQMYNALGNKIGGVFHVTPTAGAVDQSTPMVKALVGGGFVVAWDDANLGLRAQAFNQFANAYGGIIQLTPPGSGGSVGNLDITQKQNGDVVFVWGGADDDGAGIDGQVVRIFNVVNGTNNDDRLVNELIGGFGRLDPGFQASDSISGFAGNDVLQGLGGAQDILDGGTGTDIASYIGSDNRVSANLLIPAFSTGEAIGDRYISIEGFEGTFFGDQLTGNNLDNELDGVDGDDFLEGNGGNDHLIGNAGKDDLTGGIGNDTMEGQDDLDTLDGGAGNDTYIMDNGLDRVTDSAGIDTFTSTVSRSLATFGTIERLTLLGSANINGVGNNLNNLLNGNTGNNSLVAAVGADTLNGGIGNDTLTGAAGDDTLMGNAGNDRLIGGANLDRMTGSAGNDIFEYNAIAESALGATRDIIIDFNAGTPTTFVDRIDLLTIDANAIAGGNQAFTFIGGAAFANNAPGRLRVALEGGNTIVFGNTDNDAAAEFSIQVNGNINLRVEDFLL